MVGASRAVPILTSGTVGDRARRSPAGGLVPGDGFGRESPRRRRRCERPATAPVHPQAGGVRRRHRRRRHGRPPHVAGGLADADPARRHDHADRRLRGRDEDPRRGGPRQPRPDHHAHDRAGRAGEGPRPPGRRRRLPDQAVPPGRAPGADEEPDRPLRAERLAGRAPADGPDPRLLRCEGRRRDDDDRDQRGDRAPGPRPAGLPRRRQPPVRRPPRVPRPRAGPQEHRRRRQRTLDGHGPHPQGRPDARLRASTCCSPRRRPSRPTSSPRATCTRCSSSCAACTTTSWSTSTSASTT